MTKSVKRTENERIDQKFTFEQVIYANLLHGWFNQAERFETFARKCASNAKIAAQIAKESGI